jgi:fluoride ion exporter CrcB/FEX
MADVHRDVEHASELAEFNLPEKPDGPAAAAMLAAGIGLFVLGLMTVLNEMSEAMHDFLEGWEMGLGVGPLAGKTTIAALAFFVAWIILAAVWRRKNPNLKTWFTISIVLGILGALGTFPPIFLAFAAE